MALSKIIEKSVALQLNDYLTNNNLHETFQSAYKVHRSTETVMVKVQDDILHGIDSNRVVVLFMLHLSAAFDTVSHEILLNRLTQRYGITGSVQKSYLLSRTQFVHIECSRSSLRELYAVYRRGLFLGLCYIFCIARQWLLPKQHFSEFLAGVCRPVLQILTLFQTKNAIFQTRFKARVLNPYRLSNLV